MTITEEVKAKLDVLGTLGPIYEHNLPATPDVCGAVMTYGGPAPERLFGVVGIGYEYPAIQLSFRGAPYDGNGPVTRAKAAMNYLMSVQPGLLGITGSVAEYLTIDPQQAPFPMKPVDVNGRHTIGFNIYIKKRP